MVGKSIPVMRYSSLGRDIIGQEKAEIRRRFLLILAVSREHLLLFSYQSPVTFDGQNVM